MGLTRAGMVSVAAAAGHPDVSERLVTDWAERGLLDHPTRTRRGKGGGRGARYEWSDDQGQLFLYLLSKRRETKQIARLCFIPVGVWLYWRDQFVPTRQARVALRTWWEGTGDQPSKERSDREARAVVRASAPPGTPRRHVTALREEISRSLWSGKFDTPCLEGLVQEVLGAGQNWGPFQLTSEDFVKAMTAMTVAISRYGELTEGHFVDVRARHRVHVLGYVRDYPRLVSDPTFGSWFEEPSFETFFKQSCRDVLTGLGLLLIAADEHRDLGPPPLLDWQRPPDDLLQIPHPKA